ncbi:Formyl-coenzyme a transferase, partial [Globisporangium splendens]
MASIAPATQEVLHDLINERGLVNWQIRRASLSAHGDIESAAIDMIYGRAHAGTFDESRLARKRKPLRRNRNNSAAQPTADSCEDELRMSCCFLVVSTASTLTMSMQRMVEMEQIAATTCADDEALTPCERVFLCLTDAANVRKIGSASFRIRPRQAHTLKTPSSPLHMVLLRTLTRGRRPSSARSLTRSVTTINAASPSASSGDENTPRKLPLEGVRVIECGHLIAGPFAGTILSYFGADVIKIEPPTGDQVRDYRELDTTKTSLWWYSLGRNKRSVSLDIKSEKGRELIRELVTSSDVLIENFKPGRMEKWGLGPDTFEATNPALVYARVSGFGQDGPYSSRPGFASVCEAMGGFRYVNGFPDRPPVRQNLSLGDTIAGIHAALGIVIALLGRERSGAAGKGQVIDVAIYETMFNLMEAVVPEYDYSGSIRECSGSTITGIVPSNTYTSADGKNIVIAANTDTLFIKLMNAIGREDMASDSKYRTNGDRVQFQQEIDDAVAKWTATQQLEKVVQIMEEFQVPVGLVYSVEDMIKDEHFQHRKMFEEVEIHDLNHPTRPKRSLKIPAIVPKLKDTPGRTQWAGRKLGQDTRQVLRDVLKLSESEIEALLKEKVVFEPSS